MNDIVGHKQICQYFDKLIQEGSLHHAYCFVGPEHVGKQTVARSIAARLLRTEETALSTHPHFLFITTERDEKKDKTRHAIDIGQIRQMISSFSLTQGAGEYQIALIEPAALLTAAASNALLKTLEEPRRNTVIILITSSEEALLPTVRSRSHMIRFSPVSQNELISYLDSQKTPEDHTKKLLHAAHGLPGLIKKWVESPESFTEYLSQADAFTNLLGQPLYKKMKFVEGLLADEQDHQEAKERLSQLFDIWQLVSRDHLYQYLHQESTWPQDRVMLALKRIQEAKFFLRQNVNPRLLVEQIMVVLP